MYEKNKNTIELNAIENNAISPLSGRTILSLVLGPLSLQAIYKCH